MKHFTALLIASVVLTSAQAQEEKINISYTKRDIPYTKNADKLQTLDVYAPLKAKNLPVVVWIHGGGWQAGDKAEVYDKPQVFNGKGFIFVSVNYRLLPKVDMETLTRDVSKSVRWVHDHIAEHGGDPKRLLIMGHSAGAQLAALLCTDERYLKEEGLSFAIIKGCVPVDGDTYDIPAMIEVAEMRQRLHGLPLPKFGHRIKFGNDPDKHKAFSAVTHVAKDKGIPPFLILYVAGHPDVTAQALRLGNAETVARANGSLDEILQALHSGTTEFQGESFIPVELLDGCSLLIVENQPLLYAAGTGARQNQFFVGTLMRDNAGQFQGAGGWWVDPGRFIRDHMIDVVQERLPGNPRMYGGLEQTRRLSVQILGPGDVELGRVRSPYTHHTEATVTMSGPFEHYKARVSPTENAPIVWTERLVILEIAFIVIMALAIIVASALVLRYTMRQLELAQLKSGFVSNVSHELKTPIALIRLAVETLEMGRVSSDAEREKFIGTIGRETLRLSRLVDNILDFARIEAGQKVLRFERVDVAALVRETLDSFRLRLEDQGFAVSADLPDSLPPALADPIALSHCLLNLFDNAIKYSRERREVRISAAARDEFVTVSVSDRGIGISAADQKLIFEKFVRVETGLVHDVKGAGLGLSLVDQIMRAHGGRVEVSSEPGEGSTFTLLIPIARENRTPAGTERSTESAA